MEFVTFTINLATGELDMFHGSIGCIFSWACELSMATKKFLCIQVKDLSCLYLAGDYACRFRKCFSCLTNITIFPIIGTTFLLQLSFLNLYVNT